MYLITAGLVLALGALWIALLTSPNEARTTDSLTGFVVVTAMGIVGLLVYWAAYLGHQRSAEVQNGQLHVRSWLRLGPIGTDRTFMLSEVQSAVLLRPHHVELTIPGVSTRVGTYYQTLRDVDRFGTFWWYDKDYGALLAALTAQGVKAEYRHFPGLGTLLSAR